MVDDLDRASDDDDDDDDDDSSSSEQAPKKWAPVQYESKVFLKMKQFTAIFQ